MYNIRGENHVFKQYEDSEEVDIPASIKVCFGTICANACKTATSYISKAYGVKRGNTCDVD
jgi:hypothetical protein